MDELKDNLPSPYQNWRVLHNSLIGKLKLPGHIHNTRLLDDTWLACAHLGPYKETAVNSSLTHAREKACENLIRKHRFADDPIKLAIRPLASQLEMRALCERAGRESKYLALVSQKNSDGIWESKSMLHGLVYANMTGHTKWSAETAALRRHREIMNRPV
jgi:hypothetical protein